MLFLLEPLPLQSYETYFFLEDQRIGGFIYLDNGILTQILRQKAKGISAMIARCFFPVQKIERWEKLGFIISRVNFNEI